MCTDFLAMVGVHSIAKCTMVHHAIVQAHMQTTACVGTCLILPLALAKRSLHQQLFHKLLPQLVLSLRLGDHVGQGMRLRPQAAQHVVLHEVLQVSRIGLDHCQQCLSTVTSSGSPPVPACPESRVIAFTC